VVSSSEVAALGKGSRKGHRASPVPPIGAEIGSSGRGQPGGQNARNHLREISEARGDGSGRSDRLADLTPAARAESSKTGGTGEADARRTTNLGVSLMCITDELM